MVTTHRVLGFLVLGGCLGAALLALVGYRRARAGQIVAHGLALAQTLVVAELAVGLLLLADDRHADERVHYMYGGLAVVAVAWPFLYAPKEQRTRLLWFAGATLLAAVLALRAYMTA